MATQYDPMIIEQFADKLYEQADALVLLYGVAGFVIGALPGSGCALAVATAIPDSPLSILLLIAFLCTVVGTVLGVLAGRQRAFTLRLQAQTALCQARIEWNTRRL
jgi:ABC-type antimicrobial peptide transport system permease subunit